MDTALDLARSYPTTHLDEATLRRLACTQNAAVHLLDGLAALQIGEESSELIVMGCGPEVPDIVFATMLANAELRARSIDFVLEGSLVRYQGVVESRGYARVLTHVTMSRELGSFMFDGAAWRDFDVSNAQSAYDCYRAAFSGAHGVLLPFEEFQAVLLNAQRRPRVLLCGGDVVAMARVVWRCEATTTGEIRFVCRHPSWRGEGLGKIAVTEALRVLAEMGATTVELDVASSNEVAKALYANMGFQAIRTADVYRLCVQQSIIKEQS
jgi:ribosomal protein S18 acetylase RimI-like enzyme